MPETNSQEVDVFLYCTECNTEIMGKVWYDVNNNRTCYKHRKSRPKYVPKRTASDVEQFTPGDTKILVHFRNRLVLLREEEEVVIVSQSGEQVIVKDCAGKLHSVMTTNLRKPTVKRGVNIRPTMVY
jgi:hypothetical protein